jgi:uncharacterized protein YcfJ
MKKSYLIAVVLAGGLAIGVAVTTGRGVSGTAQHVLPASGAPAPVAAASSAPSASAPRAAAAVFAEVLKVTPVRHVTATVHAPCVRPSTVPAEDDSMASSLSDSLTGSVLDSVLGTDTSDEGADPASLLQPPDDARPERTDGGHRRARAVAAGKGCDSVLLASSRIIGYDVRYRLAGVEHTLRSKTRPATMRLPVRDGRVLLP